MIEWHTPLLLEALLNKGANPIYNIARNGEIMATPAGLEPAALSLGN